MDSFDDESPAGLLCSPADSLTGEGGLSASRRWLLFHPFILTVSIILVYLQLRRLLLVILSMVVILGLDHFRPCLLITCLLRRHCHQVRDLALHIQVRIVHLFGFLPILAILSMQSSTPTVSIPPVRPTSSSLFLTVSQSVIFGLPMNLGFSFFLALALYFFFGFVSLPSY
jgi:hypothetical protein